MLDDLPEKIQEIQRQANLKNSPRAKNKLIDREYREMVGEGATKLEWNKEKLLDRVQYKSLYKSGVVRNVKRLLKSQLGANIDNNYVPIGHPLHVGNEEQLDFI